MYQRKCIYCEKKFIPERIVAQEELQDECQECGNLLHLQSLLWNDLSYRLFRDPKNQEFLKKRVQFIKSIKQQTLQFLKREEETDNESYN